jgi:hypothetical protein
MKRKRILAFFLTVVLVILGTVTATAETERFNGKPLSLAKQLNYGNFNYWNQVRLDGGMLEKPNVQMGDVTLDGTIDAVDALFALQYSVNYTSYLFPTTGGMQISHNELFEKIEIEYFNNERYKSDEVGLRDARFYCYYYNSSLVADANMDRMVNAEDALSILQCAVGKRQLADDIDFLDYKKGRELGLNVFFPWPDDWEPRMIRKLSDGNYKNLKWPVE